MLTHFSLCSGIGGLDLAAEWAGFTTIGQCEIEEYPSKTLAKNFKGVKNYDDVRTITSERLARDGIRKGEVTVLSAGIPCQPYSLAGKGLGDRDERDLEQELVRVIGELRPRWIVVENTPGLFARKNQRYFDRILTDISALGYRCGWGMWGACDVGAPHRRERVFIVCRNADLYGIETKQKVSEQNTERAGICREVSNAFVKRRNTNEIQYGDFKKGGRKKDKRHIQKSGLQPKRIYSGISDTCCKPARRKGALNNGWWKAEPDVGRVANGVSSRVDRLRCLGNAVVPLQAYPIFKAIADYENSMEEI